MRTKLGRICKNCEKRFIPNGKYQKLCDDCIEERKMIGKSSSNKKNDCVFFASAKKTCTHISTGNSKGNAVKCIYIKKQEKCPNARILTKEYDNIPKTKKSGLDTPRTRLQRFFYGRCG